MVSRNDPVPRADPDPRRSADTDRTNMPEGLRRERKSGYGPNARHDEKVPTEKSRHAENQQIVEDD